jgi:HEPN domain-containing protein
MQPNLEHEADRWLDQALRDLDDARYNRDGNRFNLACFVAQQAAEKALKSYLMAMGTEPWGHSVAELCADAGRLDPDFAELHAQVAPLDKFYIPTRYPNGLPGGIPAEAFSREDADSAVDLAARVIGRVEAKRAPRRR